MIIENSFIQFESYIYIYITKNLYVNLFYKKKSLLLVVRNNTKPKCIIVKGIWMNGNVVSQRY